MRPFSVPTGLCAICVLLAFSPVMRAIEPAEVEMSVRFSHMPILAGEKRITMLIHVRNHSDEALPVVADPEHAMVEQIRLRVANRPEERPPAGSRGIERTWSRVQDHPYRTDEVPPGGEYVFALSELELMDALPMIRKPMKEDLVVEMLVGKDLWSRTECTVEVVEASLENAPVLYDMPFPLRRRPNYRLRFHAVTVAEQQLIVASQCFFVCLFPPRGTPRFAYETGTKMMTISFDGTDVEPVLYNVQRAMVVRGNEAATPIWAWLQEWRAHQAGARLAPEAGGD